MLTRNVGEWSMLLQEGTQDLEACDGEGAFLVGQRDQWCRPGAWVLLIVMRRHHVSPAKEGKKTEILLPLACPVIFGCF